jgi:valyl-tRNA synthetase
MTSAAGQFAGLTVDKARRQIKNALEEANLILERQPAQQSIRVHERCDTPVEYIISHQWFIRVLDFKDKLLEAGERVSWYPKHMKARYLAWVENLNWDWCISRQRYFGVPFPVWYCNTCGQIILAEKTQLPVEPTDSAPMQPCTCGSTDFSPEEDIMDTWTTSSMTPQIVGQWSTESDNLLYNRVFPFSLRPQAHEIIRTWAFYTIVKSHFHFSMLPWDNVFISGWGIAGEGMGKISKSRGGGPMAPMDMIDCYSADAVRYWAASTGPGKDAVISEEKIKMGAKLVTKIWNVARFSERFLQNYLLPTKIPVFTSADRWILATMRQLIQQVTQLMQDYEYAAAKSEVEHFFWRKLADNYLEMCKQRLYDEAHPQRDGARYTLYNTLLNTLKLFAPFLPYVTEEIYLTLFSNNHQPAHDTGEAQSHKVSIHTASWPIPITALEDPAIQAFGELLVEIATAVRRYKSEHNLPLGTEIAQLQLHTKSPAMVQNLKDATADLASICRVRSVTTTAQIDSNLILIKREGDPTAAIEV